ncbi:hypothetical protein EJB05_14071, partial [Eragrostis curvula]
MPPPPELMEELVEEVLLRVPPDDPALLLRAALTCKRWCRLISDPRFRRRFRRFHRVPPVLGVINNDGDVSCFVPTSSFRPPYASARRNCHAIDARHGRVLLNDWDRKDLIMMNPITGEERRLPMPLLRHKYNCWSWNAVLLYAVAGCDHLDCAWGPFRVVFVATDQSEDFTSASIYSSDSGTWIEISSVEHPDEYYVRGPSALVENALYFVFVGGKRILKVNLGKQELTLISLPSVCEHKFVALMTLEHGGLGFAYSHEFKLYMWSREADLNRWVQYRVIDLGSLLPVHACSTSPDVISFADGASCMILSIGSTIYIFGTETGCFKCSTKLRSRLQLGAMRVLWYHMSMIVLLLPVFQRLEWSGAFGLVEAVAEKNWNLRWGKPPPEFLIGNIIGTINALVNIVEKLQRLGQH